MKFKQGYMPGDGHVVGGGASVSYAKYTYKIYVDS